LAIDDSVVPLEETRGMLENGEEEALRGMGEEVLVRVGVSGPGDEGCDDISGI
jgi:hypothetical protein